MCTDAVADKKRITSVYELGKLLGKRNIVWSDTINLNPPRIIGASCLCPIDIEATAIKAGWKATRREGDYRRWYLSQD